MPFETVLEDLQSLSKSKLGVAKIQIESLDALKESLSEKGIPCRKRKYTRGIDYVAIRTRIMKDVPAPLLESFLTVEKGRWTWVLTEDGWQAMMILQSPFKPVLSSLKALETADLAGTEIAEKIKIRRVDIPRFSIGGLIESSSPRVKVRLEQENGNITEFKLIALTFEKKYGWKKTVKRTPEGSICQPVTLSPLDNIMIPRKITWDGEGTRGPTTKKIGSGLQSGTRVDEKGNYVERSDIVYLDQSGNELEMFPSSLATKKKELHNNIVQKQVGELTKGELKKYKERLGLGLPEYDQWEGQVLDMTINLGDQISPQDALDINVRSRYILVPQGDHATLLTAVKDLASNGKFFGFKFSYVHTYHPWDAFLHVISETDMAGKEKGQGREEYLVLSYGNKIETKYMRPAEIPELEEELVALEDIELEFSV